MSEAERILKLIETVSTDDTTKLDEIDLAVERYWTGLDIWRDESGRRVTLFNGKPVHVAEPHQYTRSRDALKAIRPEGWYFDINNFSKGTVARFWSDKSGLLARDSKNILATEELAELHAIIQAIEYERRRAG